MKESYWDNLADNFSANVLEITERDIGGVIGKTAKRLGGRKKTAIDFGCGAGASTRAIAPFFGEVLGVDFSADLLRVARRKTAAGNVAYKKADLACLRPQRFACDAGFCFNVLLSPDAKLRETLARNVIANIKKGGIGVFITPSMESWMRVYQAALSARESQGFDAARTAKEIDRWFAKDVYSLSQGLVDQGGVATKHYFEDELRELLEKSGLANVRISKVRFPWSEALEELPDRFSLAPPFDWMAEGVVA